MLTMKHRKTMNKMNERNKMLGFLCVNLLVLVFELIGLYRVYAEIGNASLIYYTQLSNIFLLVAVCINIAESARSLTSGKGGNLPMYAWRVFHAAVSATTVTFLVVVLVLSWMYGNLWYVLTAGSMLYTHTLCPLIALGAFLIFAPKMFSVKDVLRASSFTLIYGLIAIVLNAMRVMRGPYPFLLVYEQSIWVTVFWIAAILGGACVLSRLILLGKVKK